MTPKHNGRKLRLQDASILSSLETAHTAVSTSITRMLSTPSTAHALAKRYQKIRARVLSLAEAEKRVFYAACRDRLEDPFVIEHVSADHGRIEQLLRELDGGTVGSPPWMQRLVALRDAVDGHLEEERDVLYPRCEDAFDDDELHRLDRAYRTVETELAARFRGEAPWHARPTRAHPLTQPVRRSA